LAVLGLGYVGLPLAVEFARIRSVIGYDINPQRVRDLRSGVDPTLAVSPAQLKEAKFLAISDNTEDLERANCYIVTVPTPIDSEKFPDLSMLISATAIVGNVLGKGDLVIFESTVYPGAVEEDLVPVLEKSSRLRFNKDFFCGYSPERINPGDSTHTLPSIKKITSGSTAEVAELIDSLYRTIITAGTCKVKSIKIAEAAKVIENAQRDINIALVNELAIIFNKMGIETEEVLEAAGTKWNFQPFRPGLVGGHCIGIDPYYLTFKAKAFGYEPQIITAGRKLNDSMPDYVVSQFLEVMASRNIQINLAKILIMGLSFKENCPDVRNTLVLEVFKGLVRRGCTVDIFDPWVTPEQAQDQLEVKVVTSLKDDYYDGIIIAVGHTQFLEMGPNKIRGLCKEPSVIYDLKYVLDPEWTDLRL
jgi:UDP-N-acetyl-D-galactosamine dehydrogenase